MNTTAVIVVLAILGLLQIINFITAGLAVEYGDSTHAAREDVVDGQAAFILFTTFLTIIGIIVVIICLKTESSPAKRKIVIIVLVVIAMFQFALAVMYAIVTTYNDKLTGSSGTSQYEDYYRSFYGAIFFSFLGAVPLSLIALFMVLFDDGSSGSGGPPGSATGMA